MAKIIAFVNQKGGVGKTTSALNVAAYLASFGRSVLLVDLDPQGNASSGMGVDAAVAAERNVYRAIIDGVPAQSLIVRTTQGVPDVLPATTDLAGANVDLVSAVDREYRLREVLDTVRMDYDYVIIDSAPSLGVLTINGLVASDCVIVPVQTEYFALEGLGHLLHTIGLVQQHLHGDLTIMGAILTMFDRRNRLARQVVQEVQDHFPGHVFSAIVPRNIRLAEAPSFGQTIFSFDAFSPGARAYRTIAKEIIEMEKQ